MHLSINYELQNEDVVRRIRTLCDALGLECSLEERSDWLRRALRPAVEGSTHLLVVVTQAAAKSWWLPFQLGRASERGLEVLPYAAERVDALPSYLDGRETVRGHDELASRLRRLKAHGR